MGIPPRSVIVAFALLSFILAPSAAKGADWRDVTDDRLLNAESDAAGHRHDALEGPHPR